MNFRRRKYLKEDTNDGFLPNMDYCPVCGGTRFDIDTGICADCGYDESGEDFEDDYFADEKPGPDHTFVVGYFENTAGRNRRPTTSDDILHDVQKFEIHAPVERIYSVVARDVLNRETESNDEARRMIEYADWGDGEGFVVSIYDVTNRRFKYGDTDSLYDLAVEYNDENDLRAAAKAAGINFDELVDNKSMRLLESKRSRLRSKSRMMEAVDDVREYVVGYCTNDACRERRPSVPEDSFDEVQKISIMSTPSSIFRDAVADVLGYSFRSERSAKGSIQSQDIGDGAPFIASIYDTKARKFLYGNAKSLHYLATEFVSEDEVRAAGEDLGMDFDYLVDATRV